MNAQELDSKFEKWMSQETFPSGTTPISDVTRGLMRMAYKAGASSLPQATPQPRVSEDEIKRIVDRFLQWKLPENFNPDGGISFERMGNAHYPHWAYKREPVGTNLFDATQAEEMIRYLLEELAAPKGA